jgi:hypothetical protein
MTITIDITPKVKAALARQAAAQGREVESYTASLLETGGPSRRCASDAAL